MGDTFWPEPGVQVVDTPTPPPVVPTPPTKKFAFHLRERGLSLKTLFLPLQSISPNSFRLLVIGQLIGLLIFWSYSPIVYLPQPGEVWKSFNELWLEKNLLRHVIVSIWLSVESLAITAVISLVLGYASSINFFRPFVMLVGKLRFLSLIGLQFFFIQAAMSDHGLKVSIIVFSIAVFYVTSIMDVLATIPQEQCDLARTLRMSEWRVMHEVVVLGQCDRAFDALRQNAAIGWIMLTVVEGLAKAEGGIGTLLINENKVFHLSAVLALQLVILGMGLTQDWALGWLKMKICPYSNLKKARQ